jgi:hypothetical protein
MGSPSGPQHLSRPQTACRDYAARIMSPTIEQLTAPDFVEGIQSLSLDEIRTRRGLCQDAEEGLSLRRRLVQGRLDIIQAELYRRAGGTSEADVSQLVDSLPDILVEHGDRHLGPGRLTSLGAETDDLGPSFDAFSQQLESVVDGARLSNLAAEGEGELRSVADQLDGMERSISHQRHQLHKHIDRFQEEIVRRYKTGDASVDSLLES